LATFSGHCGMGGAGKHRTERFTIQEGGAP
jgi:hypothetical protein